MEELTLHYYLKQLNLIILSLLILVLLYSIFIINKKIILSDEIFTIEKGESFESTLLKNTINISDFDIFFIKIYFKINNYLFNKYIHYGDFNVKKRISTIDLIKIITKPSNILSKITIIEGWSQSQLSNELSKYFKNFKDIPYADIIADTYYFNKNISFDTFKNNLKNIKTKYFIENKKNIIFDSYSEKDLMVIGSLIEKEGLDNKDKEIISSVIFNRLKKNMKLQIDATVLFVITKGLYNLNRKLLLTDLKIDNPFNTYIYKGLPPEPISYVGKETLDIIFENHKSDFLFYFFNYSLKRHIFSETYKEHKTKLNEYRSN